MRTHLELVEDAHLTDFQQGALYMTVLLLLILAMAFLL
jgi:hypothetical protein